jgi:tetratricopeptide (TPR) repeat protein
MKTGRASSGWFLAIGCVLVFCSCATSVAPRDLALEYYNIGNAYYDLKKYDKAADYYNRALSFDRTLAASKYNLAVTWVESGQAEKALPLFMALLDADPKNVKLISALAYALSRTGESEQALRLYESVLDLAPYDTTVLYNYAILLRDSGDLEKARELFAKVVAASVDDLDALLKLSGVEVSLELYAPAIGHLESYRLKKPDSSEALRLLATAYEKTQYYQKAIDACDAELKLNPRDGAVLFMKARMLLTAVADEKAGLEALDGAFAAGFSDEKQISALAESQDLVDPDVVKNHIAGRGKQNSEPKIKALPLSPSGTRYRSNPL